MSQKKYTRKLQKVSSDSYTLNIPKEIIDRFRWQERQKIEFVVDEDKTDIIIHDWKE